MTDDLKLGQVDHITRAVLPWRTEADLTECGKPVAALAGRLVTRDEAAARIRRIGQQRAAFTLCMTCATTSDRRNRSWVAPADAVAVVARATSEVRNAYPSTPDRPSPKWTERQRLVAEFEAIAALIAAHPEEFYGYLSGREQTVSLADRRRSRGGIA